MVISCNLLILDPSYWFIELRMLMMLIMRESRNWEPDESGREHMHSWCALCLCVPLTGLAGRTPGRVLAPCEYHLI